MDDAFRTEVEAVGAAISLVAAPTHYLFDKGEVFASRINGSDREFSPVRVGHCRRPDQKLMESF